MTTRHGRTAEIGVIGGSGFYAMTELDDVTTIDVSTPFGSPTSPLTVGSLGGRRVAFLARHGDGHRLLPSELPAHANIHALKQLGVTHLLSVSAVGSLREELPPGTMVLPDQVIDRTAGRDRTFFEGGMVAHVSLADPFCPAFQQQVRDAARDAGVETIQGGTYVCIEGPQFSTRAESRLFRQWGADIIGMTAMPEVRLAREAGICYAILATVTDYDVWHDTEDDVSVESVMQMLAANVERGRKTVAVLAHRPPSVCDSGCATAPARALATAADSIPPEKRPLIDLLASRAASSA
jgi:5'-methylthioadenosine phosphorylase